MEMDATQSAGKAGGIAVRMKCSPARTVVAFVLFAALLGLALRLADAGGNTFNWFVFKPVGTDSWMPIGAAYERVRGFSQGRLYDLFFVDGVKFQYPPSSLLPYWLLDTMGIQPTRAILSAITWISILATVGLMYALSDALLLATTPPLSNTAERRIIAAAFALATLVFYPIMKAYTLGQIQAWLNALFLAACLCWVKDRKFASGTLIALICLIKPQFCLFLVWALIRREYVFVKGFLVMAASGGVLSLYLFGLHNNIQYFDVLSFLSRHGESYHRNQSVNGLMHRLLFNGENLRWLHNGFPPFSPVVYITTLISSGMILAYTLLLGHNRSSQQGSILDLTTAALAFTIASPVAWEHHYGIMMPLFGVIAAAAVALCSTGLLLAVSALFLLGSSNLAITEALAGTSLNVLQSYLLFAGLGCLILAYRDSVVKNAPRISSCRRTERSGLEPKHGR